MAVGGMTAPRLRGRLHQVAFFASIPAGIALVVVADSLVARVAVLVYALSLTAMFGTSAALHRLRWSPPARLRMDRLDRTMIYVLIAGSYTPVCLLALRPGWRVAFLAVRVYAHDVRAGRQPGERAGAGRGELHRGLE